MKISIYRSNNNRTIDEYLVNFEYFTRLLRNYGFVPINETELKYFKLPSAIGSFEILFNLMNQELEDNKFPPSRIGKASEMTDDEKFISFLNNYFIFKKIEQVDAKKKMNILLGKTEIEKQNEDDDDYRNSDIVKKMKRRLILPSN